MVKSILIVDDQHEVRRMLRAGIETLDPEFQVLDLPSAEESLVVISMQPVDLLVTDIRLPGISGLELMQKIRKRNPGLKVIVITGLLDPDLLSQVKQAGAEAFFTKPIQMTAFLDAVGQALDLKGLGDL
jgi:DNA-binding NtrC family response regulator